VYSTKQIDRWWKATTKSEKTLSPRGIVVAFDHQVQDDGVEEASVSKMLIGFGSLFFLPHQKKKKNTWSDN